MQAARYNLLHNDLYKRTYDDPLAKCLGLNQTQHILEEVHEGHCGAHSGEQALVRCPIWAEYYWPIMKKDASEFVKKCEQCQKYVPTIYQSGERPYSVTSLWPFIKWRMDIVGPLPPGQGAFSQVHEQEVITFIWNNIICRFVLPKETSCDNGPSSTPYHPDGNGQAKSSNKSILNIMKKKLEEAKELWPEILPEVLWAQKTTPKTST
ncbi:uncharacterized protein LOC142168846 [Nicotiana tabacum]|uniref:Uncharacterized protein LOC142168846 n=1 Tax=Nicotiana tabacum TaxID=4097 RepID=A0AC58SMA7_TOBAC